VEEEKMIKRDNWLLTEKYLKGDNSSVSGASVERYGFSLRHLLLWADNLSFEEALNTKGPSFTAYVANLPARNGDGKIALESQKIIILVSKKFLEWATENREKGAKKISPKRLNSFVHPNIPQSASDPISVSLEEMLRLASFDCGENLVYQRDLAAIFFAYLSGARAGAIATAPIKSINLQEMHFLQYPELGVKTKNSKKAQTFLLPIPELFSVVKRWDDIVRSNLPDTSLWYSPMDNHWGEYCFTTNDAGENRNNAIIKRFRVIYEKAGMKESYKSPHKFRHGHAVYGLERCKNMAEYQAVSRNLMHSSLAITDKVYSVIERQERQIIISSFVPEYKPVLEGDMETYLNHLCREDRIKAIKILADSMSQ
jgi:integrase